MEPRFIWSSLSFSCPQLDINRCPCLFSTSGGVSWLNIIYSLFPEKQILDQTRFCSRKKEKVDLHIVHQIFSFPWDAEVKIDAIRCPYGFYSVKWEYACCLSECTFSLGKPKPAESTLKQEPNTRMWIFELICETVRRTVCDRQVGCSAFPQEGH